MKNRRLTSRILILLIIFSLIFALTGCIDEDTVELDTSTDTLSVEPESGSDINLSNSMIQELSIPNETFTLMTNYNTCSYDINTWKITDCKAIEINAWTNNLPEGMEVYIEHVHVDISLKSQSQQLNGLTQDSMDDTCHSALLDGFSISNETKYNTVFAIEGFSKDIIDGWGFYCGSYGSSSISSERLTEDNLKDAGKVYANKVQIVYDLLIKSPEEKSFHTSSVLSEFIIPIKIIKKETKNAEIYENTYIFNGKEFQLIDSEEK